MNREEGCDSFDGQMSDGEHPGVTHVTPTTACPIRMPPVSANPCSYLHILIPMGLPLRSYRYPNSTEYTMRKINVRPTPSAVKPRIFHRSSLSLS